MEVLEGRKRSGSVLAEAKYEGQSQQETKIGGLVGKGPQTFSTVFTRIAGDFGLVAQNPLTENGLLFMILSSSAVPVWDLIKTRIIKLFERKHWLRIYRSVKN